MDVASSPGNDRPFPLSKVALGKVKVVKVVKVVEVVEVAAKGRDEVTSITSTTSTTSITSVVKHLQLRRELVPGIARVGIQPRVRHLQVGVVTPHEVGEPRLVARVVGSGREVEVL